MDHARKLHEAIAEFERLQAAIGALGSREDTDWKKELVQLRRSLQMQISIIEDLTGKIDKLHGNDDSTMRFRSSFSRLRTALAFHQASWPASTIVRDDPDYKKSILAVRASSHDFLTLAHQMLALI